MAENEIGRAEVFETSDPAGNSCQQNLSTKGPICKLNQIATVDQWGGQSRLEREGDDATPAPAVDASDATEAICIDHLAAIHDLEMRFLSALWRGLPSAYEVCIAERLDNAEYFAYPWHGEAYRCLMACGLQCIRPNSHELLEVVRFAFPRSHLRFPDQLNTIWLATSSAACLPNLARLILRAARVRKQASKHIAVARRLLTNPFINSLRRAGGAA